MVEPSTPGLAAGTDPRRRGPQSRRRGPRWRRVARVALLASSALVIVAAVAAYGLYRHYNGQITRVSIRFDAPQPATPANAGTRAAASGSAVNILLMGSDSRDFAGGQSYNVAPGSAAYVTGQRSDVVILLHVPAGRAKATLVSFPRDSWLTIPAYTDAKGLTHRPVQAKLNAAFALGGAPLLVSTIEALTGVHIDHFASVNFPGFQAMVDAIGGLNVCVATARHDRNSGDFLTSGQHHIDGAQALALVRDRKSFPDQDLGRIKDQEYFLATMMHKVLSSGTLTNPLSLNNFLNAATKSLTIDTGFSLGDIRKLANRFAHLNTANLAFATVPVENANYAVTSSVYGGQIQSAVELDPQASAALYASLAGSPTPTSSAAGSTVAASSTPPTPAGQLMVNVENATTTPGLGRRASSQLAVDGVDVVSVGNAPAGTADITVIRYPPGRQDDARALQRIVPEAQLRQDDTVQGVTLDVGANYTPAGGRGSQAFPPAPRTDPSTSAKTVSANDLSCAP